MFQLRPWVTEVGGKGRQAATADTLRSSSAGRAPGRFGPLRTASHRFAPLRSRGGRGRGPLHLRVALGTAPKPGS